MSEKERRKKLIEYLKKIQSARRVTNEVSLDSASNEEFFNQDIKFKAVVAGKDLAPYQIPKKIFLKCTKSTGTDRCSRCPLVNSEVFEVDIRDRADILEFVGVSNSQMKGLVRRIANLPKCEYMKIEDETKQNIEEVKLIPEIEFVETDDYEYVVRKAYFLGNKIKTNQTYSFEGTTIPDPRNQQVVHILEDARPIKDNIDEFKLDADTRKRLDKFKVGDKSIKEKLDEIYNDFEQNVTHVYKRKDIILSYDLVFHSVLSFQFVGEDVKKGWLELFLLGDSRTGKTKTLTSLIGHYRAGERISAENTSIAGLVAGLQQTQNRWTLMWGKIPLNDKRLLAIDEASGLKNEDYGQLSDVRSSGVVEVTKIQIQKTRARTRLIFVTNPLRRRIAEFNYGVLAIKEIVGQNEDIARFDFALSASDIDVGNEEINRRHDDEKVPNVYDSKSCHDLVMFAWSRKKDQVIFEKQAEDSILQYSNEFSEMFTNHIPLVQGAEIRIKLAKLSVALACRVYSTDDKGETIIVKKCHVDFIRNFLISIYSKPGFDYLEFSKQKNRELKSIDSSFLDNIIFNKDVINILLASNRHNLSDFEMIFDKDKREARDVVSNLMKCRAIKKYYSWYVKTPAFIVYLKNRKKTIRHKVEEDKPDVEDEILF